jgi:hypothetical protein
LLAFVLLTACATGVEEGLFMTITSTATAASNASNASGDDGSDDARNESSDGSSGSSDPTGSPSTTHADTGPAPTDESGAADTNPVDPSDTSGGDPTVDPTVDPSATSNDPTIDPTGVSESSTGIDPTGVDPTGMGVGDCCAAQAVPGCGDATIEGCVCAVDDYCCSTAWDDVCVGEATDCGAGCGGGGGGGSDCCMAQAGTGCSDATIEACVCGVDDYCCSTQWDDICASEAIDCGAAC